MKIIIFLFSTVILLECSISNIYNKKITIDYTCNNDTIFYLKPPEGTYKVKLSKVDNTSCKPMIYIQSDRQRLLLSDSSIFQNSNVLKMDWYDNELGIELIGDKNGDSNGKIIVRFSTL